MIRNLFWDMEELEITMIIANFPSLTFTRNDIIRYSVLGQEYNKFPATRVRKNKVAEFMANGSNSSNKITNIKTPVIGKTDQNYFKVTI